MPFTASSQLLSPVTFHCQHNLTTEHEDILLNKKNFCQQPAESRSKPQLLSIDLSNLCKTLKTLVWQTNFPGPPHHVPPSLGSSQLRVEDRWLLWPGPRSPVSVDFSYPRYRDFQTMVASICWFNGSGHLWQNCMSFIFFHNTFLHRYASRNFQISEAFWSPSSSTSNLSIIFYVFSNK